MYNHQQFIEQNPQYLSDRPIKWDELKLAYSQSEFDIQCQNLALQIDIESAKLIDSPEIKEYSYPINSLNFLDKELSIMRLGFVVDQNMQPKLIEINSQTPSFFWECHDGLKQGFDSTSPDSIKSTQLLAKYLENQAKLIDIKLNRVTKPRIAIVCCDHPDDLFQMGYVQSLLESSGATSYIEVFTIENLDINAKEMLCSIETGKEFDAIMLWYPIEWLAVEKFQDGSSALESIFELVKKGKPFVINGMQSFVVQNKEFLSELCENDKLSSILTPSFCTKEELEAKLGKVDFIAKPIFGREGQGIFGQKSGVSFEGDLSDSYYTDQNYIYQVFVESPDFSADGKMYKYTLEKWVVKIDGKWFAGGRSLRLNPNSDIITNNMSKWAPLV
jgi:glutathionylspermidine synthase